MPFIIQGKTNWRYILIIIVLAAIIGGGVLVYISQMTRETTFLTKLPKITRPEKVEPTEINKEVNRIDYSEMLGVTSFTITKRIDLEITDPDNLVLSKEKNEIIGASYTEEDINGDGRLDDLISIPEKKLGEYRIKVIPEPGADPKETFSLEISVIEDKFGYVPIHIVKDVTIGKAPKEYIFKSKIREETHLEYKGDLQAKYLGRVNLKAILTNSIGNPLPNKEIEFEINPEIVSVITDSKGVATASLVLKDYQEPSKWGYVDFTFWGDQDYLPAMDTKNFEILE